MTSLATVSFLEVDGANVFYREAGPCDPSAPTILLLHGFPSSSHQFRNLMPLLAAIGYHVIAPDFPGFGFTTVPDNYVYTFANLTATLDSFVSALNLQNFAIYVFDYGAPVGLRLAIKHPENVAAIVSQNGNAYNDGFGAEFWAPIQKYWASGSKEDRDALRALLEFNITKSQYTGGSPNPEKIQPEAYYMDQTLMDRPGNKEVQLDLFYDYRTNVDVYPAFHKYFRTSKVPVLAMWGKNDTIFIPPGAEAFRRDVENLDLRYIEAGHFAIETNEQVFAEAMHTFFKKYNVFDTRGCKKTH